MRIFIIVVLISLTYGLAWLGFQPLKDRYQARVCDSFLVGQNIEEIAAHYGVGDSDNTWPPIDEEWIYNKDKDELAFSFKTGLCVAVKNNNDGFSNNAEVGRPRAEIMALYGPPAKKTHWPWNSDDPDDCRCYKFGSNTVRVFFRNSVCVYTLTDMTTEPSDRAVLWLLAAQRSFMGGAPGNSERLLACEFGGPEWLGYPSQGSSSSGAF